MSKEKENQLGKISRRTFLTGTAAMGGILGLGALTASASSGPADADPAIFGESQHAGFDLPVKRVDEPTYTRDIVGKLERFDERETVFERSGLKKGTPEYEEYYSRHPEQEKWHDRISGTGLGSPETLKNDFVNFAAGMGCMYGGHSLGAEDVVEGPVAPEKIEVAPDKMAAKIKGLAQKLGADLVTIGPCRDEWLYSNTVGGRASDGKKGRAIKEHYKNSINIGIAQDYEMMATGDDTPVIIETGIKYARIALITVSIAHYIRSLGYRARANNYANYIGLCVPLAIDGGMGELGRNGFLVTKEYGTNLRLGNILTDLPMILDKPVDLGVQDFCSKCKLCAEWCPSGSIPMGEKVEVRGVKKWQIEPESCYEYWQTQSGGNCGLCQMNCPWSKPPSWIHSMAVESATHSSIARSLLPQMEKVVYGEWKNHKAPDWITNTREKV